MDNFFFSLVIYPLTQIIELVFSFCRKLFNDTGIAILGVSAAVSILTLPLYIVAEHWQQVERDAQRRMKGEVDKIKTVFKGSEQYMILSTYYRQNHYHPIMSLRSAFGLLIQIPFFTAAYICLSNMTALQEKPFLFIRDMGRPDALFSIGSFTVNILPVAMTLINMTSGFLYTRTLNIRDKLQTYGLALLFAVILYNSPAGMVMYWTTNNIFSLVKNIFYKTRHPIRTLYYIVCALVTVFIIWIFTFRDLSGKQSLLVLVCFSLVYPAPLYVKAAEHLVNHSLVCLRDSRKARIFFFALSAVGLTLLVGLFIPTRLIASSPEEFCGIDGFGNPMVFVMNTLIQSTGIFIVWSSLIFFLYKEKMQTLIAFALSALFACGLVNFFFFHGNYGTLSKLLVFTNITSVDSSVRAMLLNILVIILTITGLILVMKSGGTKIISVTSAIVCMSLLFVSLMNTRIINGGFKSYEEKTGTDNVGIREIKPFLHFSKTGKNIVYIYLDRAQNQYIEPLFEECGELYEQYSGFTLYKNTVSFNGHTLLGAPACYGGYEYTPESMNSRDTVPLVEKQNECLLMLPRIFTEQGDNYSATVTDPTWANYSWIPDLSIFKDYPDIHACLTDTVYLDTWYKEHQDTASITVISETLKRNILWYSLFRISILALRPAFYNDGVYWSTNSKNDDFNDYLNGYSALDYLIRFTDFDSKTENVYINFTNNTTHDNLFLQAPDYVPVAVVTDYGTSPYKNDKDYHSMAGAMRRIGDWLSFLKDNGVYDNTRIVIVADHGANGREEAYNWDETFDKIRPGHYHPLLMFKDFGAAGNLIISDEFMTNADTPLLLTQGVIEKPVNPYTGSLLSPNKDNGALICTSDMFMPYQNKSKYVFKVKKDEWVRVKNGSIFDSANWSQEIQE